jgi:hypothetical protein
MSHKTLQWDYHRLHLLLLPYHLLHLMNNQFFNIISLEKDFHILLYIKGYFINTIINKIKDHLLAMDLLLNLDIKVT